MKDSIKRKMLPAALTAAILALGATTHANATLYISYSGSDGINSFAQTCQDNTGCDLNGATGVIAVDPAFMSLIAGLTITSLGSTSVKALVPGGLNTLLGGSLFASYTGAGASVTIHSAFGDNSYLGPATRWQSTGSGTWGSVTGASTIGSNIAMDFWDDPANSQGADVDAFDRPGNLIDTFSNNATGGVLDSFSFNHNGPLAIPDISDYSMTMGVDYTIMQGTSLTAQGQGVAKSTVPEPGSMLLLGTALAGLGFIRRRKAL